MALKPFLNHLKNSDSQKVRLCYDVQLHVLYLDVRTVCFAADECCRYVSVSLFVFQVDDVSHSLGQKQLVTLGHPVLEQGTVDVAAWINTHMHLIYMYLYTARIIGKLHNCRCVDLTYLSFEFHFYLRIFFLFPKIMARCKIIS